MLRRSTSQQSLEEVQRAKAGITRTLETLADTCKTPEEKAAFEGEMKGFAELFGIFLDGQKDIEWDRIRPPPPDMVVPLSDIETNLSYEQKRELLSQLVVLKLNGGLGTSMGCQGPKSAIEVRAGYTFLDLTIRQIEYLNREYKVSVPLVLMNSFNTHNETEKILHKYENSCVDIHCFNQHRYPRVYKETLRPVPVDAHETASGEWYPPGHGDVFDSFLNSEAYRVLAAQDRQYVFISNIDNLGATVEFNILKHMAESRAEYIMELTNKTRADVKGGTLIQYEDKARLLEIAQVPRGYIDEFKSVKKFKIFNTNNLWVNLKAIDRVVKSGAMKNMDVITNLKSYQGKAVIQLERAAGAAIQFFEGSHGINVPRSRFLPVKGTSDLFVVQSNLYTLSRGQMVMNPARPFPTVPLVKLGDQFNHVEKYLARFTKIPDILELDHLTVSGDVTFGSDVVLAGTVIIVANHGSRIDIPSGSKLENKVVSGNLRILDH
mmetsp:Transcript_18162/g.70214  ORF Transcript_18162/g.70214 Transcript_18162/m.70214 type:complete len:492 (-) Transcript_18162:44-1519(-)